MEEKETTLGFQEQPKVEVDSPPLSPRSSDDDDETEPDDSDDEEEEGVELGTNVAVVSGHPLKKGPWTPDEDKRLRTYVEAHGEGNWNHVQRNAGLNRCGKSCRLRWANHLRPHLKKGPFSKDEDQTIIELHEMHGNKLASPRDKTKKKWDQMDSKEEKPPTVEKRTSSIFKNLTWSVVTSPDYESKDHPIEPCKFAEECGPELFQKLWNQLQQALHVIYNGEAIESRFYDLQSIVYRMVINKHGPKLFDYIMETVQNHVDELVKSLDNYHDAPFLEELQRASELHNSAVQSMSLVLLNLKDYIRKYKKTNFFDLGLELWRDTIIRSTKIRTKLVTTLLDLIYRERKGEVINRLVMRSTTKMLMDLWGYSIYQNDFERPFLEASASFYMDESHQFIVSCTCGEYLKKAQRRLDEEAERVSQYMDSKTDEKITAVVVKETLTNHMQRLFLMENSGLVNMISEDNFEDLTMMYNLFLRVPDGHSTIISIMTAHVKETGKSLVTDPERMKDPVEFVQQLINEKDKYDTIISTSFGNDKSFQNALNSSFEYFINLNNRSPEFVSLYVDKKLRKGRKDASEEDVETVLDKVIVLFRYLQEKDIFQKYYKQHMARRLLSRRSASDDSERSMLVKLKAECGLWYTYQFEEMFADMKISQDIFQDFSDTNSSDVVVVAASISVMILKSIYSPTQPCSTCNLPPEILSVSEKFKAHYLSLHNGRRLTWQTNMGSADMKVTFGNGSKHELNVSTYQMCVLMLFNTANCLSYRDIEQATAIPPVDLKRCLQSLSLVKGKNVLRKNPMSRDISADDSFYMNENFVSKLYRVKLDPVAVHMESIPENLETRRRVEEERKYKTEAAVVRIMKAMRVLEHKSLVTEVTKQLPFMPSKTLMKKVLESLIDREYLKRDKEGNNYMYIA